MKLLKGDGMNSACHCRTEYVIIVDVDIFKEFVVWFYRDWFVVLGPYMGSMVKRGE